MIYTIPLTKDHRIRKVLDIFDHLAPFSLLTGRERDVLAEYINKYYALKEMFDDDKISEILFKYNYTTAISEKLEVSTFTVRNNATKLRQKGLLNGNLLSDNTLALFDNVDNEITFKFKIKD